MEVPKFCLDLSMTKNDNNQFYEEKRREEWDRNNKQTKSTTVSSVQATEGEIY